MIEAFRLPPGLLGRFAVVKLWPEISTAEDECIARLKAAAESLGLECIEVFSDGRFMAAQSKVVSQAEVDFVIHLHYETPKFYDVFSFIALWNPTAFYHQWGYERCSRNLLTHDDFLSCSSPAADDHVARMIRGKGSHLPPLFNLYHSLASAQHEPALGDLKLFYAGINWDVITGGKSRHQSLLKGLDKTGALRIYGPKIFQGHDVWAGYESYVEELPFDGISIVDAISRAGIALVLSSEAHKDSELMSSRLFESIAAGALIICDENPFAKRFFGDTLLYVDTRLTPEEVCRDILRHLAWAEANAEEAIALARKAQSIFSGRFTLQENLKTIYSGFAERRLALKRRQLPAELSATKVDLCLLLPTYSFIGLKRHIQNVNVQTYEEFSPALVIDTVELAEKREEVERLLATSPRPIEIVAVDFFEGPSRGPKRPRRRLGRVLAEILGRRSADAALMLVAPNEELYSNHLHVLAGSLTRNPGRNCASSAVIHRTRSGPVHGVHDRIDFGVEGPSAPAGFARFIFRPDRLPADLDIALRYLDEKALAVLVNDTEIASELSATVIIDVEVPFPKREFDANAQLAVIRDFAPLFSERFVDAGRLQPVVVPALEPAKESAPADPDGWAEERARNERKALGEELQTLKGFTERLLCFLAGPATKEAEEEWLSPTPGSLATLMLNRGWGLQESWGKWGIGDTQTIILPLSGGSARDLIFAAEVDAVLLPEAPYQDVDIVVSEQSIGHWRIEMTDSSRIKRVLIPRHLLSLYHVNEIELRVSEPRSPSMFQLSNDDRLLGVKLTRFCLYQASPDWQATAHQ